MIFLRSVLFNLFFFSWTFVLAIIGIPIIFMGAKAVVPYSRFWVGGIIWAARVLNGIEWEIRGREHLPEGAAIIASKHQSAWETFMYPLLLPQCAFILKKELRDIPLFGKYLHEAGAVVVDRKKGAGALKDMVAQARDRLGEGRQIIVFPEGTRVAPGETGKYHSGIAAIYAKGNAPVVPVALNSGLFWGRYSFKKQPGTVILEFLEPIQPGLNKAEFMQTLQERIEGATKELLLIDD